MRVELMIKATIYGRWRWMVCSDTQIASRASVCAQQFACGYQQSASLIGGCHCTCVSFVSFILAVNLLEIHDAKCQRRHTRNQLHNTDQINTECFSQSLNTRIKYVRIILGKEGSSGFKKKRKNLHKWFTDISRKEKQLYIWTCFPSLWSRGGAPIVINIPLSLHSVDAASFQCDLKRADYWMALKLCFCLLITQFTSLSFFIWGRGPIAPPSRVVESRLCFWKKKTTHYCPLVRHVGSVTEGWQREGLTEEWIGKKVRERGTGGYH